MVNPYMVWSNLMMLNIILGLWISIFLLIHPLIKLIEFMDN